MRRLLVTTLLTGACLAVIAPAASGAAAPAAGLRVAYGFGSITAGTVADSSPAHLNGALQGTTRPVLGAGPSGHGRAISLDSTRRQYVEVADSPILDVDHYTIAAWVRYLPKVHDERWEVLEKADAYWMNIRTDTRRLRVGGFYGGCTGKAGVTWFYVDTSVPIKASTWTHVASTYDGTTLRAYVDGVQRAALRVSGRTCSNGEVLAIGAKKSSKAAAPEAYFDGRIDDVRVYDRALTAAQIRALRSAPVG